MATPLAPLPRRRGAAGGDADVIALDDVAGSPAADDVNAIPIVAGDDVAGGDGRAADGVVGRAVLDDDAVVVGQGVRPVASVPMKSPATMLPVVPVSEIYTPFWPLAERTSPAPAWSRRSCCCWRRRRWRRRWRRCPGRTSRWR